jgi:hypothetical protein
LQIRINLIYHNLVKFYPQKGLFNNINPQTNLLKGLEISYYEKLIRGEDEFTGFLTSFWKKSLNLGGNKNKRPWQEV